ncbi:MAG: effector binding domain-containing protein [Candidatus Babeliales bacterium]|jgi:predicted transcriptional regulator YdeE
MVYQIIQYAGCEVIGLALTIASGNQPEQIMNLWQNFMANNVATTIEEKIDNSLVGLYTDYTGDHTNQMTVVIGAPVKNRENIPSGLVHKTIPAGKYALFTASSPEEVGKVWHAIWSMNLPRTFIADFELYKMDGSLIEIYVGIQ